MGARGQQVRDTVLTWQERGREEEENAVEANNDFNAYNDSIYLRNKSHYLLTQIILVTSGSSSSCGKSPFLHAVSTKWGASAVAMLPMRENRHLDSRFPMVG